MHEKESARRQSHLSSRSGRIISGLTRARLWRVMAASMVPNLLKIAILREGRRHCTKSSMSFSVSFASSVVMLYQRCFL